MSHTAESGLCRGLSTPEPTAALRILIVEDSADTALSQAILLRHLGYEVEMAVDGGRALEIAKILAPDVVLLDIGLPGMSGWELAKLLQEQSREKPPFLIAISGYGTEDDLRQSHDVGIDLHLLKPVDQKKLAVVLRKFQRVVQ